MAEESIEERQNNEFEALQAIFGDDVVDNRAKIAWKIWHPLDLMLTLQPLHNSDVKGVYCSITLQFKCCTEYPNKVPTISINKMNGISIENGSKLLSQLENLASDMCGEVMIFQLAQYVQQFLHDHNKPTLSFYDEMLAQKTEAERAKQQDIETKENEERQRIKDEIQKRQEILREKGRHRIHRSSVSRENSDEGRGDAPELVFYADDNLSPTKKMSRSKSVEVPCNCSSPTAQVLRITMRNNKKVYISKCLGHSSNGATTYLAIDDETGDRLVSKKWTFSIPKDFQTRTRQLSLIHQDLKSMCRLKHPNLVPYVAMETPKDLPKRTAKQCVYIFRDFILGTSLKYLKYQLKLYSDKFEVLKLIRHVGLGVFSALSELHSVNVCHMDVRSENIFLDITGCVKLVGAGLDMRMAEAVDGGDYCDRQTKVQDVHSAAHLLLSLISPRSSLHEIPPDLPTSAKDFFSRCLTDDEESQWGAAQLVTHAFLVDSIAIQPKKNGHDHSSTESEDEDSVKKIQHNNLTANSHSRLNAEFEVLNFLGKGAFGDVMKVKNKLDGGLYAIKCVKLNPENVQLNKKITREVKLLSRLNHENVVRYFNAWIESMIDVDMSEDTSVASNVKDPTKKKDSLEGIIAKLGQEVKIEWSITESPMQARHSDSESEDENNPDPWGDGIRPEDDSSSDIEFEADSNKSQTIPTEDVVDAIRPPSQRMTQVLYIQMEFCEKHTLRQAIDNGLYQEHFRAWRLFREIVEGLAHVHQRGMIHRDLKPVNIFLDSNDHVKIGDFGLATKVFTGLPVEDKSKQEEFGGSLTGQIGTALYVAPELLQAASKVIYNQKVDIYSLGIILFEMFHAPLSTGMERMMVLTDIRKKDILLPDGFDKEDNVKQVTVIRWLLDHDASLRPTCTELLSSEHVPRPVPEGALSGLLSHTLTARGSRGYQRLVAACLDQQLSAAEELTYHDGMTTTLINQIHAVKDIVTKVFRCHGATEFSPPLLTPRCKHWDQYPNAVKLMTASGSVCHLPHDLRIPFARHTAYTQVKYMRRYVVDRVYRERHVQGFHPREIVECAFDIVTPRTDSLWTDSELLVVAYHCAKNSNLKVSIQLNHTSLLRTLLLSCGVPFDKHSDLYIVLMDACFGRITSLQLQTHLTSLCISNTDISNLLKLMEADVQVYDLKELVTPLVRQAKWSKAVAQAIFQLEAVCRNAKALGCDCQMSVAPLMAYNAWQHSGIFWSMSVHVHVHNHRKHRAGDVVAAGGRYDALVEDFWKFARTERDNDSSELNTCSVGFSMSLHRMAAILQKLEMDVAPFNKGSESPLICICLFGNTGSSKEGLITGKRANIAAELWAGGYSVCVWTGRREDEAHEVSGADAVLLGGEGGARLATWQPGSVREHKLQYIEVLDFIKQKFNPETVRSAEVPNRTISWNDNDKSNSPMISVTFITGSEKITKNSKRNIENQISTQVTSTLVHLGVPVGRARVQVAALAAGGACVRALAAQLTVPLHAATLADALTHVQSRKRDILLEAVKELENIVNQNNQSRSEEVQLYALYSIPDSICRLIT